MPILDHIGYVVADIEEYLETFFIPLFKPSHVSKIITDPLQQVRVAFVTLQEGSRIELLQPTSKTSPVSNILEAKKGGLYHVCYSVANIEQAITRFCNKGCLHISGPMPAVAFNGRRIAFLYTPQSDVIELVEQELKDS